MAMSLDVPVGFFLVGLRIVGAFETFATEVSAKFTSIGTTMYTNV